jgi:hypothetical protein
MYLRRLAALLLVLWPTVLLASTVEIVENGGFENGIEGWDQTITGTDMHYQRLTDLDHDEDFEVRLYTNDGDGLSRLRQRLPLPDTGAVLSVRLATTAISGNGAWSVAGLIVGYRDESGILLGETALVARSADCPWAESPILQIIDTGTSWADHDLVIADALEALTGVEADVVRELDLAVIVSAYNC